MIENIKALISLRVRDERGQGNSEYIAVVIPIAIALIVGIKFFDTSAKCKFDLAFRQIFSGYQVPAQCMNLIREGTEEEPENLAFEPLPFEELFEPPVPPAPPTPPAVPPPPAPPIPPGTDPVRHHLGDGRCTPPECGGMMTFEGTGYNKNFSVDTQAVHDAGIDFIRISFLTAGVTYVPGSSANVTNAFQLNGQKLGNIVNGYNEFIVPASSLLNNNVLTLNSSAVWAAGQPDYDDYEFWDLSVTFV